MIPSILCCLEKETKKINNKSIYLSHFFNKQGSNGKNMSSLSNPPKLLEYSDSSKPLNIKVSDGVNKLATFAC